MQNPLYDLSYVITTQLNLKYKKYFNAGQANKHTVVLLCNKTEVPVLFCSGGTEPGDLVWRIPVWD